MDPDGRSFYWHEHHMQQVVVADNRWQRMREIYL